jgi:hypothetical protein
MKEPQKHTWSYIRSGYFNKTQLYFLEFKCDICSYFATVREFDEGYPHPPGDVDPSCDKILELNMIKKVHLM